MALSVAVFDEATIRAELTAAVLQQDRRLVVAAVASQLLPHVGVPYGVAVVSEELLLEAVRREVANHVLAVISRNDAGAAVRALRVGATGVFTRDESTVDLGNAVVAVGDGSVRIPPPLLSRVLSALAGHDESREQQALRRLTGRELQVFLLVAEGRSRREIVAELIVSEHTVRTHLQNIRSKLQLHTQLELAALARRAVEQGWLVARSRPSTHPG